MLLDVRETWESTTKEEHRDFVHIMIQEVGVDVTIKRVLWVKARLDYEPPLPIIDGMRQDPDRRFWKRRLGAQEDNCGIEEVTGHMSTGVEIVLQMSHNLKLRQKFGQFLSKQSLRAVFGKQSLKIGDCHAARRALAARNDDRSLWMSELF